MATNDPGSRGPLSSLSAGLPQGAFALQRAVEAVVWGTPIVSLDAMRQAFFRDAGGAYNDIVFWSQVGDAKLQLTTPNASTHYVYFNINMHDGPLVLELPAAVGAGLFGSILDAWQVPLVDVGPQGSDQGKGGTYLLLPPGFDDDVPPGVIAVPFETFNGYAALRAIPADASEDALGKALDLVHQVRLYPLAQSRHPPKQRFIDMSGKLFDAIVRFDDRFFERLARILDEEPVHPRDAAMMEQLRSLGIERGKVFAPDAALRDLLTTAARTAHAGFIETAPQDGAAFWPNRHWRSPNALGARTGFTFQNPDGTIDLDARGLCFFLACAPPAKLGKATFYLLSYVDRAGQGLHGDHTYRLHVPSHVPASQFWAATVYESETAAFFRDAPCVEINSYAQGLEVNPDGSIDLYVGSEPPSGKRENWVYTAPGKAWFTIFRFYGPEEPLFAKSWQLTDLQLVEADELARMRRGDIDGHGWIGTENLDTRYGKLAFAGGYPTADTVDKLYEQRTFQRAVEVYLSQLPAVSIFHIGKGLREAGVDAANRLVIFKSLMDAQTLLLTGNTETVYAFGWLDLHRDGPTVIEAPPGVLGGLSDLCARSLVDIGPPGPDRGKGGRFLILPPDHRGPVPPSYFVVPSHTNSVWLGLRGFLVDGKPDDAVALLESTKIYPFGRKAPEMTFINGSERPIDTVFTDTYEFFEHLSELVQQEPVDAIAPTDRFFLAAIGIEKGRPFAPDARRRALLGEAARVGAAMARVNTFASRDPASPVYPDRTWEWAFLGGNATFDAQGYTNIDRRAAWSYAAIGSSPAMVLKVVGGGSQYLWTPRDASGAFLDGGKRYRLRLPPNIPVERFWSVVVYDAISRSELRTPQRFPSISSYTGPVANDDGSIDLYFGPTQVAGQEHNWIQTVPGRGWFPYLRFYGPTQAFFDQAWKPDDIVEAP